MVRATGGVPMSLLLPAHFPPLPRNCHWTCLIALWPTSQRHEFVRSATSLRCGWRPHAGFHATASELSLYMSHIRSQCDIAALWMQAPRPPARRLPRHCICGSSATDTCLSTHIGSWNPPSSATAASAPWSLCSPRSPCHTAAHPATVGRAFPARAVHPGLHRARRAGCTRASWRR